MLEKMIEDDKRDAKIEFPFETETKVIIKALKKMEYLNLKEKYKTYLNKKYRPNNL